MRAAQRRTWPDPVAVHPRTRPPHASRPSGHRLPLRGPQQAGQTAGSDAAGRRITLDVMRARTLPQLLVMDDRGRRPERNGPAVAERPLAPVAVISPNIAVDVKAALVFGSVRA